MIQSSSFKAIAIVVLSLSLIQCSFKKDDGGSKDGPDVIIKEQVETGTVKGANLQLSVVPLEKVHEYGIRILWKVPQNCDGKIQKRAERSNLTEAWVLDSKGGALNDTDVLEGSKYFYSLVCIQNGAEKTVETVNITTPKDLTLEGDLNLAKLQEQGLVREENGYFIVQAPRILLAESLKLKTEGRFLKLISRILVSSRGARVYTFSEDEQAADGRDGKNGGKIQIEAEKAVGFIDILLVGQNGGNGFDGDSASVSIRGAIGQAGADATYIVACRHTPQDFGNMCIDQIYCNTQPEPGKDGGVGQRGIAGKNGGNGGSSGASEIRIVESQLKINVVKRAGRGGPSGLGGQGNFGGLGGRGGDGSLVTWMKFKRENGDQADYGRYPVYTRCKERAPDGQVGPNGQVGDSGGSGQNGFEDKSFRLNPATSLMEEF